jgi:hypothetical protein
VLAAAASVRAEAPPVTRLQAELRDGGLFVVREGERLLAATTVPHATAGLVFYDLRTCLRTLEEEPAQEQPKPRKRKGGTDAAA